MEKDNKSRFLYDCENLRYLFDFSLMPSVVFEHGVEFVNSVVKTNGELLFDMMQDYYEGLNNDIKRRGIRIFDKRRIKVCNIKLQNDWAVCCIEMPHDINGSSPVFCNAYYIAIKENKPEIKNISEDNQKQKSDEIPERYDDEYYEDIETVENTDTKGHIIRFFTVEEIPDNMINRSLEIYKGLDFGKRKLCEIKENGDRKEYGETERDVNVNLIKVGVILGAIDNNCFKESITDKPKSETKSKDDLWDDDDGLSE